MKLLRYSLGAAVVFFLILSGCQKQKGTRAYLVEENSATSSDGTSIHYRLYGKGDVALVFVHGWCTDKSYWNEQIPSFAVNYTVVTLDLAGHGASGADRTSWTMEAFGADVAAVVEKLDLKKVVLVGHGMGGPVILEAATLLSDRLLGLVGADSFTDLYMNPLSPQDIEITLEPFLENFQTQMREFIRTTYFPPKSDQDLMKRIIIDMASASPQMAVGTLKELLEYDGSESFKQVNLSVRCVNSDWITSSFQVTKAHAKSLWVDYIQKTGHFVMLEEPLQFNRFLAGYVSEFVTEAY